MLQKFKNVYQKPYIKMFLDVNNLGLYVFLIIMLALSWSSVGVVESNYRLEKQIAAADEDVGVQELVNRNQQLRNEYFKSNQYLELSARRQFGKAAPGEKLITVPREIALKHAANLPKQEVRLAETVPDTRPQYQKNLEDWFKFFTHRLN